MQALGKWLLIAGLVLALMGLLVMVMPRVPWLGRLPGDIHIKRDGFQFYFPIVTCLVVSVIINIALYLFRK